MIARHCSAPEAVISGAFAESKSLPSYDYRRETSGTLCIGCPVSDIYTPLLGNIHHHSRHRSEQAPDLPRAKRIFNNSDSAEIGVDSNT